MDCGTSQEIGGRMETLGVSEEGSREGVVILVDMTFHTTTYLGGCDELMKPRME